MPPPLRYRTFTTDEPVRVSICSITYNHRHFIEACLEGFLDQECSFRVEIVVHDDASDDGTAEIVQDYATRYPTIVRPILQVENQYSKGVNPYYAYAFPAAQGEYIAICDGDDFWSDPAKLARQVAVLDAEPTTVITYGSVRAINEHGEVKGYKGGAERDLSSDELKAANPINTLTTCFRNIFCGAPPPVFLRNSPIGDLTVWGILGYHGTGRYLADMPRANYRIHEAGVLSLLRPQEQVLMTALAQLNLAAFHRNRGDMSASKRALKSAVKFMNGTGFVHFADMEPDEISFWKMLRLWRKGRRLHPSDG